jgi:ribosome maturation factor RimP
MGPMAHFLFRPRADCALSWERWMATKAELVGLLEPAIATAGYELVELEFSPASRRALLRVYIDRADGGHVTLDDCATASGLIGAALDVADPIERAYELEVSSPGFDRPLRKRAHFERYLEHEARVELDAPLEGRRKFRGRLVAVDGDELEMEVDGRRWRLPLGQIHKARLVA